MDCRKLAGGEKPLMKKKTGQEKQTQHNTLYNEKAHNCSLGKP